jgi:hypothetical protein
MVAARLLLLADVRSEVEVAIDLFEQARKVNTDTIVVAEEAITCVCLTAAR